MDTFEHAGELALVGPMTPEQAAELRFLCSEFAEGFDATLTEGEAALVVRTFLDEPMSESQAATLNWLARRAKEDAPTGLSYGRARSTVRRMVAMRGLRSA